MRQRRRLTKEIKEMYCRLYDEKMAPKVAKQLAKLRAAMLKKYNLTEESHRAMFDAQGWKCAICSCDVVMPGEPKKAGRQGHVDHDHSTGAVRGILCVNCNTGMGKLGDRADRIAMALNYLQKFSQKPVDFQKDSC